MELLNVQIGTWHEPGDQEFCYPLKTFPGSVASREFLRARLENEEPTWLLWCTLENDMSNDPADLFLVAAVDNEIDAVRIAQAHVNLHGHFHVSHMHFGALTWELFDTNFQLDPDKNLYRQDFSIFAEQS